MILENAVRCDAVRYDTFRAHAITDDNGATSHMYDAPSDRIDRDVIANLHGFFEQDENATEIVCRQLFQTKTETDAQRAAINARLDSIAGLDKQVTAQNAAADAAKDAAGAAAGAAADAGPGTDFNAVERGFVSITPLQIDLTHSAQLPSIRQWMQ